MSPDEFEHVLAFLCGRDVCTAAQVVGGAGDLGADIIATTPEGWKLVIQAKRYTATNLVTGPDLQKFGGTCFAVHCADVAAVVTTSGYTRQAIEYAARMHILLYDQAALAGWAARRGPAPWHQAGSAQTWPEQLGAPAPPPPPPVLPPAPAPPPQLAAAAPDGTPEVGYPAPPGWTPAPPRPHSEPRKGSLRSRCVEIPRSASCGCATCAPGRADVHRSLEGRGGLSQGLALPWHRPRDEAAADSLAGRSL